MKPLIIAPEDARKIVLQSQLLDGQSNLAAGKEGTIDIINHLGYVQIDTIAVLNRAHHHSLWVRQPDYNEKMLHDLQAKDRKIFEYWAHAMAYLPMADYRFYLPKMKNFENPAGNWAKERLEKCRHLLPEVLQRIRNEGPLCAKDFAAPARCKGGTWWEWKPAKVALELLLWQGELMISERRKFQKIYDLREHVLPAGLDTRLPDDDEIARFLIRRGLAALGIAGEREILSFMQPRQTRDSDMQIVGRRLLQKTLAQLVEAKEVVPVIIDSMANVDYFALQDKVAASGADGKTQRPVHFLSPFDNMIIQRARLRQLFGFDYTLECYLPAAKRKFGYFVLPVLWGEQFVARFDAKAERKNQNLLVRSLHFETGFSRFDEFLPVFAEKMKTFAAFNNCKNILLDKVYPDKMKPVVKSCFKTKYK